MWREVCCQYASLDSETYEVIGDHTDRRVMAIRRDTGAIQAGRRVSPPAPNLPIMIRSREPISFYHLAHHIMMADQIRNTSDEIGFL